MKINLLNFNNWFKTNEVNKNHIEKPLIVPSFLYIVTTTECNLHCKHCHLWMTKEKPNSLTTEEKVKVIKEFHILNPLGTVIISGGETMLKIDEFFILTELCRSLSLNSMAVTNASLINEDNYERILLNGPNLLVISLDSHLEGVHDYIRGVKGAFKHVTKVIKDLSLIKKKKFPTIDTKIYTNTVLFEKNILNIQEYIPFAKELGADGVLFQCLHNVPQVTPTTIDRFFEKNFFKDKSIAVNSIENLLQLSNNDNFIMTRAEDFRWMKKYIESPVFDEYRKFCDSHEKNIIIDEKGDYMLCFSMHGIDGINNIGNVRDISLKEFWYAETTSKTRKIMDTCRKDCGILACHRKENIG